MLPGGPSRGGWPHLVVESGPAGSFRSPRPVGSSGQKGHRQKEKREPVESLGGWGDCCGESSRGDKVGRAAGRGPLRAREGLCVHAEMRALEGLQQSGDSDQMMGSLPTETS